MPGSCLDHKLWCRIQNFAQGGPRRKLAALNFWAMHLAAPHSSTEDAASGNLIYLILLPDFASRNSATVAVLRRFTDVQISRGNRRKLHDAHCDDGDARVDRARLERHV